LSIYHFFNYGMRKRPRGGPRRRRKDNIKMDLHEVEWGAWIELIWLMRGTGAGGCDHGNEGLP